MNSKENDAKRILGDAMELHSSEERAAFVKDECGADQELCNHVLNLLNVLEQPEAAAFMEEPAAVPEGLDTSSVILETVGDAIGDYKLLSVIGEGGFGVVFLAEQQAPVRRQVALKIIKPGMDSREVIARFEAERQTLAVMDHPNIAKVFDGGCTDSGRPYFVMELVNGTPLTKYCDEHRLSTQDRLKLFSRVCKALQHAHEKGIIHRDIKPSNVLVTVYDGEPTPKVIDFGVAKAISQEISANQTFTRLGQLIGTPQYMSPEQAVIGGTEVDNRSDVYALGVLLYELLTGSPPLQSNTLQEAAFDEMCRLIREHEPPTPSTRITSDAAVAASVAELRQANPAELGSLIRGKLDWIVMKALEKDRERRYNSARAFADDVDRYLNNESIEAARPSLLRRLQRRFGSPAQRPTTSIVLIAAIAVPLAWFLVSSNTDSDGSDNEWLDRANSIAFTPRHESLAHCKLVLTVETGADIDLNRTEEYVLSRCQTIIPQGLLTVHTNRAQDIIDTLQLQENWLCWKMPVSMNWPDSPNNVDGRLAQRNAGLGPKDISLWLNFAVSNRGTIQIGTEGDVVEEHLLVLAHPQGINNFQRLADTSGYRHLASDEEPHDSFIEMNERTTLLAYWFGELYRKLFSNELIAAGPQHFGDLYNCPMRIQSFLDEPITVTQGQLYHQQLDYTGISNTEERIFQAANQRWSPLADNPDQEVHLKFDATLQPQQTTASVLYLFCRSDRRNSASFETEGLTLKASDYYHFNGDPEDWETSSIDLDDAQGTCSGKEQNVASANAILYGQSPSAIRFRAESTWSVVNASFRYVTLGPPGKATATSSAVVTEADGSQSTTPEADVPLDTWTIPPAAEARR